MRATNDLGRADQALCESLAWCHSPAFIAAEISALERLQAGGDTSPITAVLLQDWRRVQAAQATLVQLDDQQEAA